jgi:hypothetical protein
VYFSGTASGLSGANNGVQGIFTDIVGNALAGTMQSSLTLGADCTLLYVPAGSLYGLGFDAFPSGGTPTEGSILGIGAAHGPPPGPAEYDMPGVGTANAPHPNGQPPVLLATGTVFLDPGLTDGDVVTVDTAAAANFWDLAGLTHSAAIVDDQLEIEVVKSSDIDCRNEDDDGDGVNNCDDKCPGTTPGEQVDVSGCPPGPGSNLLIYYRDADGDGYGTADDVTQSAGQPAGYVGDNTDCNDSSADVNPGVAENCGDGIDNDCDGLLDSQDPECSCGNGACATGAGGGLPFTVFGMCLLRTGRRRFFRHTHDMYRTRQ